MNTRRRILDTNIFSVNGLSLISVYLGSLSEIHRHLFRERDWEPLRNFVLELPDWIDPYLGGQIVNKSPEKRNTPGYSQIDLLVLGSPWDVAVLSSKLSANAKKGTKNSLEYLDKQSGREIPFRIIEHPDEKKFPDAFKWLNTTRFLAYAQGLDFKIAPICAALATKENLEEYLQVRLRY